MYNILYQFMPWRKRLKRLGLSERAAAELAGISRLTWRSISKNMVSVQVSSLRAAALALQLEVHILLSPPGVPADFSTVAAGFRVLRDGNDSWKIHYMDFVDEFRRSLDPRLLLLPPPNELPLRLKALLAAIVLSLCEESQMQAPFWARKRHDLPEPWFVAETESLKAMALVESPLPFRRNNIFVTDGFLQRV